MFCLITFRLGEKNGFGFDGFKGVYGVYGVQVLYKRVQGLGFRVGFRV